MSVLVTGGAGYIGSHVALQLADRGEDIVVIDDLSTGQRSAVPPDTPLIVGDVGNRDLIDAVIADYHVDSVVHLAGSIVVSESVTDPLGYHNNNTVASYTLIEATVRAGIQHFVFSSSASVYGMPDRIPVSEDARLEPISPYGSSKLMTELMLQDIAAAHPLAFVTLRYFNVAGADPDGRSGESTPKATHLVKIACQTAVGQRPYMEIYGTDYSTPDGSCIRDYVHVTDLAGAHLAALDHLRASGTNQVLNCGYGHGYSVLEVIAAVKRASGKDFQVQAAARRRGDPPALVADSTLVQKTLDWRPRLDDLDLIVSHALAWEAKLAGQDR